MISAFAKGGAVLDEPRYAEARGAAAEFVFGNLYDAAQRTLLRRYREGDAAIPGFLDDYAFFAQGLLDLYEAQFDLRHLELAIASRRSRCELFEDRGAGGFFSTARTTTRAGAAGEGRLRRRRAFRQFGRGDEPVAAGADHRTRRFRESAERTLRAFGAGFRLAPMAVPQMLVACEFVAGRTARDRPRGRARCAGDAGAVARVAHARFVPNRVVLLVDSPEARQTLSAGIPSIDPCSRGGPARRVCCQTTVSCPFPNRISSPS